MRRQFPKKRLTNEHKSKRPINVLALSAQHDAGRDCTHAQVYRLIDLVYGKRGLPIRKRVRVQNDAADTHASVYVYECRVIAVSVGKCAD